MNGADLIEWFADWRARAEIVAPHPNGAKRQKLQRHQHCIMPTQLREAINALDEAAETRRHLCDAESKDANTHRLIAQTYERTAQRFKEVQRILERDQTVLMPAAAVRASERR